MRHFDCVVIGSGPAGQKAAIQSAKLGKRVCIVEKNAALGGAAVNTGTIPSKALREAVLHLTGANRRGLFGQHHRIKKLITIDDLIYRSQWDEAEKVATDTAKRWPIQAAACSRGIARFFRQRMP